MGILNLLNAPRGPSSGCDDISPVSSWTFGFSATHCFSLSLVVYLLAKCSRIRNLIVYLNLMDVGNIMSNPSVRLLSVSSPLDRSEIRNLFALGYHLFTTKGHLCIRLASVQTASAFIQLQQISFAFRWFLISFYGSIVSHHLFDGINRNEKIGAIDPCCTDGYFALSISNSKLAISF